MALAMLAAVATTETVERTEVVEQFRRPGISRWRWAADRPTGTLTVSLVRADVRVVRWDRDRVELRASEIDPEGDGSPVTLIVSRDDGGFRIVDRYPASSSPARLECLPPDGDHGGAWAYHDRLAVTLMVPKTLRLSLVTLEQ